MNSLASLNEKHCESIEHSIDFSSIAEEDHDEEDRVLPISSNA